MRIVVCGEGKQLTNLLDAIQYRKDIDVLFYVQICKVVDYYKGLRVIESNQLRDVEELDWVVITSDKYSEWNTHYSMFIERKKIINHIDFIENILLLSANIPFDSASTVDGLRFIFSSKDKIIGPSIKKTNQTFSFNEINAFFDLTKKYYNSYDEGYFIDVGANIGTTSIYVQKHMPALKVIAIEPSKENYKTLKANCTLNEVENVRCINVAISSSKGNGELCYFFDNPGATALINNDRKFAPAGVPVTNKNYETVEMVSLEELINNFGIEAEEIRYLWVDTQGFEPPVIEGFKECLKNNSIALFQEFNPTIYIQNNEWEEYKNIMSDIYSGFISYYEFASGNYIERDISEIEMYCDEMQTKYMSSDDLFFIK